MGSFDRIVPYGFCYCGCGQKTTIIRHSDAFNGLVGGEPRRYLKGHDKFIPPIHRLLSQVEPHPVGCWLWTGPTSHNGYGKLSGCRSRGFKRMTFAHRLSYMIFRGPIPKGMEVCHRCDNPPCVRPDHLWLGTHTDNMRDAKRKGRMRRGEGSPHARLTDAAVREIRRRYPAEMQKDIAADLGVAPRTVRSVLRGEAWTHVR